ncbi:MAG: Flp family type IVb pilin [Myxococcota bacterium]|nr:Flp family type IVb pilin [Myxococcota bacterium]
MLKRELTRLIREEDAATAVEYAVIAALVGVALIAVLGRFRGAIEGMFRRAIAALGG